MKTSNKGIELLKRVEGVSNFAYQDSAGYWTIGVGHKLDAKPAKMAITDAEINQLLIKDLIAPEKTVTSSVKVSLKQNQFDALVLFIFNIGSGAFSKSTLLKKLNAGQGVSEEWIRWTRAGGVVVNGLLKRRLVELCLFLNSTEILVDFEDRLSHTVIMDIKQLIGNYND